MENDKNPASSEELDMEECTDNGHCHRRRSARQETAWSPDGRRRVCHKSAGWGTKHVGAGPCRLHGGNTWQSGITAERERAASAVATLGLPVDVDPATALLEEVRRTAGHVAWLGRVIAATEDPDDLVWGMVEETLEPEIRNSDGQTIVKEVSGKYRAQESVWLQLYQKERRHLAAVSKMALDAGATERMVRVYEQFADTFLNMMEHVISAMSPSPEQRNLAALAMVAELKTMAGEQ